MKPTVVEKVKMHNPIGDLQNLITCKGKFILIQVQPKDTINGLSIRKDNGVMMMAPKSSHDHKQAQYLKPLVISETEKIYEGDNVYHSTDGIGVVLEKNVPFQMGDKVKFSNGKIICCKLLSKILVMPIQFSQGQLQTIVSNTDLKNGDEVRVACEKKFFQFTDQRSGTPKGEEEGMFKYIIRIVDKQINIYPTKQTKKQPAESIFISCDPTDPKLAEKLFDQWLPQAVGIHDVPMFRKGTTLRDVVIKYASFILNTSKKPIGGFVSLSTAFNIAESMNPSKKQKPLRRGSSESKQKPIE